MKARIVVGEVEVNLTGLDLTVRQVRGLIELAAAASQHLTPTPTIEVDPTPEPGAPLGFTATIERLPEEIPKDDLDWYFDE